MNRRAISKVIGDYQKGKLDTGELRKFFRSYKKELLVLSFKQRHKLALDLYRQKTDGAGMFATYIVNLGINRFVSQDLKILDLYADELFCWGIVDDFCLNVVQPLLTKYPRHVLVILSKWNRSLSSWKRRASVVAFVRRIGESGKFTNQCLKFCDHLLNDPDRLVKQGVGWALKDNLRGNHKKVISYIKDLRKSGASSVIVLYSIRDLSEGERGEILMLEWLI